MLIKLAIATVALMLYGTMASGGSAPRAAPTNHPRLSASPCPSGMKTVKCMALLVVEASMR